LYELVLIQKVEICLSEEVLTKYIEVLNRVKFSLFANFKTKAEVVLNRLREIASFYQTNRKIEVLTDTSDNKFLELAAVSVADYLTTGNTLDFTITEFEYTKILTPREYWENYAPKE
jgi:putative PIN family toxin of toxin-antitoxin system